MKSLAILVAFAVGAGQSNFTYSDSSNDLSVVAREGQGTMEGQTVHLELKGSVRIASRRQKFNLNADRVAADAAPGKGAKSPNEIRNAKATGRVTFTQNAEQRSTTVQCATANYRASGETAILDVNGSVRIQSFNEAKKQTLIATGSSGTANLDKNSKQGYGLREATLTGSVKVDVFDSTTQGGHMIFTGNKLTMTSARITMTGNVKAQGNGSGRFGNLGKVDSIVVNLNDRKEMTSFSFKSGGGK